MKSNGTLEYTLSQSQLSTPTPWYSIKGLGLGLILSSIYLSLIIPMPPWVLDTLITTQWLLSVTVLIFVSMSVHVDGLRSLPRWLIGFTVCRLCINVITTRSILGQATGGGMIDRAGDLMMGERWIVGISFFLSVLAVQYIVIARGLERIAELTARFTLEALPGAQQAILHEFDSERSHPELARRQRLIINERSQRASAVEGLLKFVKGEQIASFVLVLVNCIGGVSVGLYHDTLEPDIALSLYGKLAIGDGLLAQLPALYCSLATTLYITRLLDTSHHKNSIRALARQDRLDPNYANFAIKSASVGIIGLSFFPIWEWSSQVVMLCVALGALLTTSKPIRVLISRKFSPKTIFDHSFHQSQVLREEESDRRITIALSPLLLEAIGGADRLIGSINLKRQSLGLPYREISVHRPLKSVESGRFSLWLSSELVSQTCLPQGHIWTCYDLDESEVSPNPALHPTRGHKGRWREADVPPTLNELSLIDWVAEEVMTCWRRHERFAWSADEVWNVLTQGHISLQREALSAALSTFEVTQVFRRLSNEGCALVEVDRILESLIAARREEHDLKSLSECLRRGLGLKSILGGVCVETLGVLWIECSDHHSDELLNERFIRGITKLMDGADVWQFYEGELVIMIETRLRESFSLFAMKYTPLKVLSPADVPPHIQIETLEVVTI